MSSENGYSSADVGIEVSDEEGLVDKKTKEHILNLRVQIDEDERELFVNKATDPEQALSYVQATQYWSVSVRQYLRGIKRLWNDDDGDKQVVKNVDEYWSERKIAEYTLTPPDKAGYKFSMIQRPDMDDKQLRRMLDLPRGVELPKPVTKEFRGLNSILERDGLRHEWMVYTEKSGAPPNWDTITLTAEVPMPKGVLNSAVEMADNFLQQAGIGFKIGSDLPSWGQEELRTAKEDDDVEVI